MLWYHRFFIQDLIDARRESVSETKKELQLKAEAHINWSYKLAEAVCRKIPGGGLSLEQSLLGIEKVSHDTSRKCNKSAVIALHKYFSKQNSNFYPLEKEAYRFGVGYKGEILSCKMKMFGLLHDGKSGCLYWNNYRLRSPLDQYSGQIISSLASSLYLDDPEYSGFDLKLVDVAARRGNDRSLKIYGIDEINLLNKRELSDFFDPIHLALNELIEENYLPKKPKRKSRDPKKDGDQRELPL